MNNCHGKHDGKFCSGSSAGGGNQIKKATDGNVKKKIVPSNESRFKEYLGILTGPNADLGLYNRDSSPGAKKKPMTASQYHAHQIKRNNYND